MKRGKKIAVIAHCLLNSNTKVKGLATYPAVHPVVATLVANDVGLVQLPCPEAVHLGMCRWGMTKEQYDVPAYHRLCRQLVEPVVDTLTALANDGCEIVGIWGVDGSPTCGGVATCSGYCGGELELLSTIPRAVRIPGEGILISILREACHRAGLDVVVRAVDEDN